METPLADTRFTGTWRSVEYHVNSPEGWRLYERCTADEVKLWTVMPDGQVVERPETDPSCIAAGHLNPQTSELVVRHKATPCWPGSLDRRFRVQAVSDDELWFYGLEDVAREPDDYHYRLKVVRV